MKQNEEAISTTGSPLFVHPSASSIAAPTVNIPLPGGVVRQLIIFQYHKCNMIFHIYNLFCFKQVMNIEPKKPKGKYTIPELDDKTKAQLRMLCEQLNNML